MEKPAPKDRRKHGRALLSKQVDVAVLGEGLGCMMGKIFDESKRGLGLRLPSAVALGTAIKIEAESGLILGEVSGCTRAVPGEGQSQELGYRVGVVVKHRLPGLSELHRLNRVLHGETSIVSQLESSSAIMEG